MLGNLSSMLGATMGGYSLAKILSALVTLLVCLIAVRLIMKIIIMSASERRNTSF